MRTGCAFLCHLFFWGLGPATAPAADQASDRQSQMHAAVERALPLLEFASARSAEQRTCFTCHHQAFPIFALTEARRRGFQVDSANLQRQTQHVVQHLERGRKQYDEGKGQGGGVDTAGYALWSLEEADTDRSDVIGSVVHYLLAKQGDDGAWECSSNRPPTEASDFTTTYLAIRALTHFGGEDRQDAIQDALAAAGDWLSHAEPEDHEDRVFQLLAFDYLDVDSATLEQAAERLKQTQRPDGGWSQLSTLASDPYATATALYALRHVAELPEHDPVWERGIQFLLDQQREDGSWWVKSRSKPFQVYYETGFPHREDQFLSIVATCWSTLVLMEALPHLDPTPIVTLPGVATKPLEFPEEDLSGRLMQVAHTFVEDQIRKANSERRAISGDDARAAEARAAEARAADARQRLKTILGVVDERLPCRMEYFGDQQNPATVAETDRFQVLQVRWPVLEQVDGEGLLLRQREGAVGRIVLIPDADQTPEAMLGWSGQNRGESERTETKPPVHAIARTLADNGFDVVVPAIVSRHKRTADDSRLQRADYTEREWIYRQAFHMGRHVIGYDLQRVLACVDWFETQTDDLPIAMAGYGEGGLIALHAGAIDPRIDVVLVSGAFDSSDAVWQEPIYRNVWSRLKAFGNAEVAALISPRKLLIEHAAFPQVSDHKGELTTPKLENVQQEFKRIPGHETFAQLVAQAEPPLEPYSQPILDLLGTHLGIAALTPSTGDPLVDQRADSKLWIQQRADRTVTQLQNHVQALVRQSDQVREHFFLYRAVPALAESNWSTESKHPTRDPAEFVEAAKPFRDQFHRDLIGQFDEPFVPPNARTRKVAESEFWTAYDVVLDVHDGLFAWGVLVIPKDLQPGERRPVVVCQHGRNGLPRDTLDAGSSAYNDFAGKLAERGFITFAPHNLYRGEDRYRWLDRKANTIGCSLFSFIVAQHDACLRWLDSLPFVDGDRIAFYGLSYGGETAVRVPTILEKYCLSICSGDFNQWTRKVASTDQPFSFMNTIEWEMPYWNLGNTFDYAEMSYLMFPRPFMVERGHHDRVGRDHWVAHELAKVRWLYAQYGMSDRVRIEFFQGGHSIHGEGTFQFLEEWLHSK